MNIVLPALLVCAVLLIQCLIGGTRLLYSFPSYAIIGIAAVLTVFRAPKGGVRPRTGCIAATILLFTYVLLRAAMSPVEYLWWHDFYMVLACLAVYFLTAFYLTDSRSRLIVIGAMLLLAVVEVFWGLRQFTGGDNWMPFSLTKGGLLTRRASGSLISPIHYAGYLEAVALFALSFAIWSTWRPWARILAGYVGLLCYVGIAISGSRGAYLSVAGSFVAMAALSLYVVRQVRPSRFGIVLSAIVAAALLALGGGIAAMNKSPMLQQRIQLLWQQFEPDGRKDVRIYNWQAALDQFKTAPVLGTGAGTHLYYGRLYRRPEIQADPIHAHGDYLEMLAEYGVVGLAGIAVFLFFHIGAGLRSFTSTIQSEFRDISPYEPMRSNQMALQIGALSAVAAYLVHSVMDFNLHIPGNALVFAFIFGMMATPSGAPQDKEGGRWVTSTRWLLPVLGLWLCAAAFVKLPGEYWAMKTLTAFRLGRFGEAVEHGKKALTYETRNPELYFSLAGSYRGLALSTAGLGARPYFEAAVDCYQRSLAVFPYDSHAMVRLAQTLDELARFKEAGEIYRAAIALDPNLSDVHAYYAKHLASLGREKEAEEAYSRAKSLAQKDLSRIIRGTFLDPQRAD